MSSIMRRRRGLNSAISLLLFKRLRFNSRNPSKQKPQPQTDPPNAASAASFNLLDCVPVGVAAFAVLHRLLDIADQPFEAKRIAAVAIGETVQPMRGDLALE